MKHLHYIYVTDQIEIGNNKYIVFFNKRNVISANCPDFTCTISIAYVCRVPNFTSPLIAKVLGLKIDGSDLDPQDVAVGTLYGPLSSSIGRAGSLKGAELGTAIAPASCPLQLC